MLTRETAIARLRATGTLSATQRPGTAITAEQGRDPVARAVSKIMTTARTAAGPRGLAPSANHAVLP